MRIVKWQYHLKGKLYDFIKTRCIPKSPEIGFKVYDEFFKLLYPMLMEKEIGNSNYQVACQF